MCTDILSFDITSSSKITVNLNLPSLKAACYSGQIVLTEKKSNAYFQAKWRL